jgi:hypothetical protein
VRSKVSSPEPTGRSGRLIRQYRCQPISVQPQVFSDARTRAGLVHGAWHESRHTHFTRPDEAGMAIEALAGHHSIASSPIGSSSGVKWGSFGPSAAKHPEQRPALARGQRGIDFARCGASGPSLIYMK